MNLEEVKSTVQTWPDSKEAQEIIKQIETIQIRKKYFEELERRPGESADIMRELAWEFNRSLGAIKGAIYT